jgi:glycosyltransferase involved in cell wall biosynthesis
VRVLHITGSRGGGVANSIAALVKDQRGRGWKVGVAAAPESRVARRALEAGARLHPWRAGRLPGAALAVEITQLASIVRAFDPFVVHLHSSKAGLAGRLLLRGRLPTIFQPRAWSFYASDGVLGSTARTWEIVAVRWTSVVVCVSDGERADGVRAGIRARWEVIPNGIDLSRFPGELISDKVGARRRVGLAPGPLVVCSGRLCHQKGQDVLLSAWPLVRNKVPDATLILLGTGPAGESLNRNLPAGVVLGGEQEEVRDWLVAADVVAVPSRWEGLAYAILEGMAAGRPVVATDVAGARESIGQEAGEVVPIGDAPRLADAISARLLTHEVAEREGTAGRHLVRARYDVRVTTARMAALYAELRATNAA